MYASHCLRLLSISDCTTKMARSTTTTVIADHDRYCRHVYNFTKQRCLMNIPNATIINQFRPGTLLYWYWKACAR